MKTIDTFRLNDKVGVVTGGAGLLGVEFCRTLASSGALVILADVHQENADAAVESLRKESLNVSGFTLDVTDPASVEKLVQFARTEYGHIDILVNSAAVDPKFDPDHQEEQTNDFEHFPLEAWDLALKVNLTGMFLVTQAVARLMIEEGSGSIINICSTYGLVGPDQRIYQHKGEQRRYKPVFYSTTKAGVLGFTRYLAAYYAETRIRVNALTPGGVFHDHDEEFVRAYSARTILGRMANVDEMNGALLFLASDASSYMTGANLVVDGGWTAW